VGATGKVGVVEHTVNDNASVTKKADKSRLDYPRKKSAQPIGVRGWVSA
jgi:hypothetical protein